MILTLVSAVKFQILLFSFPCHTLLLPTNLAESSVRYYKFLLYSINWAFFTQNNKKLMYADDVHVPTRCLYDLLSASVLFFISTHKFTKSCRSIASFVKTGATTVTLCFCWGGLMEFELSHSVALGRF